MKTALKTRLALWSYYFLEMGKGWRKSSKAVSKNKHHRAAAAANAEAAAASEAARELQKLAREAAAASTGSSPPRRHVPVQHGKGGKDLKAKTFEAKTSNR